MNEQIRDLIEDAFATAYAIGFNNGANYTFGSRSRHFRPKDAWDSARGNLLQRLEDIIVRQKWEKVQ